MLRLQARTRGRQAGLEMRLEAVAAEAKICGCLGEGLNYADDHALPATNSTRPINISVIGKSERFRVVGAGNALKFRRGIRPSDMTGRCGTTAIELKG